MVVETRFSRSKLRKKARILIVKCFLPEGSFQNVSEDAVTAEVRGAIKRLASSSRLTDELKLKSIASPKPSFPLAKELKAESPKYLAVVRAAEQSGRAQKYVQELREAYGGAYKSSELEEELKITRQALKKRREHLSIVYWTDPQGHCHYPRWQFNDEFVVYPEVKEILRILNSHDTTLVLQKFVLPVVGESNQSVIDLIRSGKGKAAVQNVKNRVNVR